MRLVTAISLCNNHIGYLHAITYFTAWSAGRGSPRENERFPNVMHVAPGYNTLMVVLIPTSCNQNFVHDDVIKWKHFPRYWPFVREIYRSFHDEKNFNIWKDGLYWNMAQILVCLKCYLSGSDNRLTGIEDSQDRRLWIFSPWWRDNKLRSRTGNVT